MFSRNRSLARLRSEHFDLVVIGGGITGAGVALDAASRGLRTALIERDDFASGTSSKSSKMVHGGLRYLQQGDVALVREALVERHRLLRNAPHLVRPLPFVLPMFAKGGVVPAKIARALGGAMWAYDAAGGWRVGHLHRHLDVQETVGFVPCIRPESIAGGYLYWDAAADDARLTLAVCRTASLHHGAVVANRVRAVGIERNEQGSACGVHIEADGDRCTVSTSAVVNAAGVWADAIHRFEDDDLAETIRPARGVHVSVPRELVPTSVAAILPVRGDRRSVFVVPQGDIAYIGTTDTDDDGPLDDPRCTPDDIAYLLGAVNAATTAQLEPSDVLGTWAGLRPLVRTASSSRTADMSRGHRVDRSEAGVVTVIGGKLTTYRRMAADAVDEVVRHVLGPSAPTGSRRCRTASLALRGAADFDTVEAAAHRFGVPAHTARHLADRYGGEARAVMELLVEDPALERPLVDGLPYLAAEAVFAVRAEMATSVDDVLSRRTRARLFARDAAAGAADDIAQLIAPDLGWTANEAAASAAEFRALCEHERETGELPPTVRRRDERRDTHPGDAAAAGAPPSDRRTSHD